MRAILLIGAGAFIGCLATVATQHWLSCPPVAETDWWNTSDIAALTARGAVLRDGTVTIDGDGPTTWLVANCYSLPKDRPADLSSISYIAYRRIEWAVNATEGWYFAEIDRHSGCVLFFARLQPAAPIPEFPRERSWCLLRPGEKLSFHRQDVEPVDSEPADQANGTP